MLDGSRYDTSTSIQRDRSSFLWQKVKLRGKIQPPAIFVELLDETVILASICTASLSLFINVTLLGILYFSSNLNKEEKVCDVV